MSLYVLHMCHLIVAFLPHNLLRITGVDGSDVLSQHCACLCIDLLDLWRGREWVGVLVWVPSMQYR